MLSTRKVQMICYLKSFHIAFWCIYKFINFFYFRQDYFEIFAPKCSRCDQPIIEDFISTLNSHWHTKCFKCMVSTMGLNYFKLLYRFKLLFLKLNVLILNSTYPQTSLVAWKQIVYWPLPCSSSMVSVCKGKNSDRGQVGHMLLNETLWYEIWIWGWAPVLSDCF